MRTLRFWFDYISSNAYLAWLRMPELAGRHDLVIEPVPVLFAGLLDAHGQLGPAEVRPKAFWMWRNNLRKAALLGVELRPPPFHPFNPLLPLRVSSLELPADERAALISALFAATWSRELEVGRPEVVAQVAEEAGLENGAALVARASEPASKQCLRDQTDAAITRGVFGVPTFEAEGELFFGYDDLPYLEMLLAGDDPLPPIDPAAVPPPPRPSSMRRRFRDEPPPSWQRELAGRPQEQDED